MDLSGLLTRDVAAVHRLTSVATVGDTADAVNESSRVY